jgi:DMSO reductase family type II enzyme heme b subunit
MRVAKVNVEAKKLLNPASESWQSAEAQSLELRPAPLALQPSAWIKGAFDGLKYGQLSASKLKALHNGRVVAVRVEWAVPEPAKTTEGPNQFADACAVMLPFVRNASFITMGSEHEWVNMWLWRADGFGPFAVTAAGLGTTERINDGVLEARGLYQDGRWHVVFVRPLNPGKPRDHVPLKPGISWQVNLALWQGSGQERGGLKSIGPNWTEINLET